MSVSPILSFRDDLVVAEPSATEIVIQSTSRRFTLKKLSPGLRNAITTLFAEGASLSTLLEQAHQLEGDPVLPRLLYYLDRFVASGLICHTVRSDKHVLATSVPISVKYPFRSENVAPERRYVLSRFAYCHREGDGLVLESPRSFAKILLQDWRATALINQLARPCTPRELYGRVPEVTEDVCYSASKCFPK